MQKDFSFSWWHKVNAVNKDKEKLFNSLCSGPKTFPVILYFLELLDFELFIWQDTKPLWSRLGAIVIECIKNAVKI